MLLPQSVKLSVLLLCAFSSIVESAACDFNAWSLLHDKHYTAEERTVRESILNTKCAAINVSASDDLFVLSGVTQSQQIHNALYDAGTVTFRLGLNAFSDLLHDEFIARYTGGLNTSSEVVAPAPAASADTITPTQDNSPHYDDLVSTTTDMSTPRHVQSSSIDWVASGAVSAVRNQVSVRVASRVSVRALSSALLDHPDRLTYRLAVAAAGRFLRL